MAKLIEHPPLSQEPTRLQRRLIDAAVSIEEAHPDTPEYLHSVLCQVGLPRSALPGEREFERSNGHASILVESGKLYRGRQWHTMPLPYGAKPRLVLIHACSEAVRTQCPEIEVGSSIKEFLRKLGLSTSGRGFRLFKNQMEALAACRMTLGMSSDTKDVTVDTKPIHRFEAWLQNDDTQTTMWPGILELSAEFYETLLAHALPLDPRAIAALKSSALALDQYTWLANRLCRVRKDSGIKLSWGNMKAQFGHEYRTSKDFKKDFRYNLRKVCAVYPDARVQEEIGGLRLFPSPPPIRKRQVLVQLPSL